MLTPSRRHLLQLTAAATAAFGIGRSAAATPMKVAIVMPGSITDAGWSQAGYDAMQMAKSQLRIETAYSEKVHQPEHVEALSDYARRGFTHVIAHGGEFQDAVDRVAARFPDTLFIVNNGLRTARNIAVADFYFSQPAYLMGALAGRMTRTGKTGVIAAQRFKFTTDTVAGFEAGFKSTRPDGRVLVTWTGDWDDVAKGKEAALNQLGQGADIVWPTMDGATVGSLQAVREKGAMAFGLYYDAIKSWPDIILQSAILDVRGMIMAYLTAAYRGKLEARWYKYDLRSPEAMRLGTYGPQVPPEVVGDIDALVARMKSGELKPQPV